jgi:oxygen-independent coproporphyrinogen-3 oxidase
MSKDKNIGVYIHIPFCRSKCYYCDFNSYSGREPLAGSYFDALYKEIEIRSASIGDRPVSTVFIGGGTPSLVGPEYIRGLLEVCSKYLRIDADAEISIESNPGTLTYESLRSYRMAGINRLSIGLQAWQDRLLKMLGRIHDRRQFTDNLEAAVRAGFDNINTDLIFGLPEQSIEDWAETIEEVTKTGSVRHISCYSLKIEEGTVFGDRFEAGTLQPADDELDRRMYHHAVDALAKKGFRQYEISNFAVPGYECRHNLIYWKAAEYAGFGAGSHSYLDSVRFNNTAGIEDYIKAVDDICRNGMYSAPGTCSMPELCNAPESCNAPGSCSVPGSCNAPGSCSMPGSCSAQDDYCESDTKTAANIGKDVYNGLHENIDIIGHDEAMSEYMILGLRLNEGITSAEFERRFGQKLDAVYGSKLDMLVKKGLVWEDTADPEKNGMRYTLTSLGSDLANKVFVEFI